LDESGYRAIAEHASDGIALIQDGVIRYSNPRLAGILGTTVGALLGRTVSDLFTDDEFARLRTRTAAVDLDARPLVYRTRVTRTGAPPAEVEFTFSTVVMGGAPAYVAVVRDVTEHQTSARRLGESEQKYRLLFESANDAIFTMRQDRFIDCNSKTLEMFRCSREQIIGQPPYRFSPTLQPDGRDSKSAALHRITAALAGEPQFFEWLHSRLDGTTFDAEVSLNRVELGEQVYLQALVRDVSNRKQTEQSLRESEWLYRTLLANLPVGVALTTPDGDLIAYNETAMRITGYEEGAPGGTAVKEFYLEKEGRQALLDRLAAHGEVHDLEAFLRRKDGSGVLIKMHVVPYVLQGRQVLLSVFEDLTEQKRAEDEKRAIAERMRQAQKLESLGILAGGIAHDFNNLLMGILGNADMAIMRAGDKERGLRHLKSIQQAAHRAADLARQMLAYSGRGRFVIEVVNLNDLVVEMHNLLESSISKRATLEIRLAEDLPSIDADATQMRQIIMNLIINASEAIGDNDGVIKISTGETMCDAGRLAQYHLDDNLPPGRYVFLRVDDDGGGMDADTRDRIFDPFFTTKFTGRGLGLAAVLGIVRGHRGAISVRSFPSKGSTFEILLPASAAEAPRHATPNHPDVTLPVMSGTILVVDDEEAVRATASDLLSSLGYKVLTANDGKEGVEVFARHRDEIAMVLLDLMMPRMGGDKAYEEIRLLRPDVRIVLMSGYSEQEVTSRFHADSRPREILQKPFGMARLIELIL